MLLHYIRLKVSINKYPETGEKKRNPYNLKVTRCYLRTRKKLLMCKIRKRESPSCGSRQLFFSSFSPTWEVIKRLIRAGNISSGRQWHTKYYCCSNKNYSFCCCRKVNIGEQAAATLWKFGCVFVCAAVSFHSWAVPIQRCSQASKLAGLIA